MKLLSRTLAALLASLSLAAPLYAQTHATGDEIGASFLRMLEPVPADRLDKALAANRVDPLVEHLTRKLFAEVTPKAAYAATNRIEQIHAALPADTLTFSFQRMLRQGEPASGTEHHYAERPADPLVDALVATLFRDTPRD